MVLANGGSWGKDKVVSVRERGMCLSMSMGLRSFATVRAGLEVLLASLRSGWSGRWDLTGEGCFSLGEFDIPSLFRSLGCDDRWT